MLKTLFKKYFYHNHYNSIFANAKESKNSYFFTKNSLLLLFFNVPNIAQKVGWRNCLLHSVKPIFKPEDIVTYAVLFSPDVSHRKHTENFQTRSAGMHQQR